MNNIVIKNILRFTIVLLLQGILLKRMAMVEFPWKAFQVYLYPLLIIILPFRTPTALAVLIAFLTGMTVDMFYYSPGVHASALVFTAFVRGLVLALLEPRSGYNVMFSPTKARMGTRWYSGFIAIMLGIHLFFLFSVQEFTFVYIKDILINTVASFIVSYIVIFIYTFLVDPVD